MKPLLKGNMITTSWNTGYSPAEAERGKFVLIDSSTITNYPSSGRGRYAVITTSIDNTVPGFNIPSYDAVVYGYTSSNLVSSETYKSGGVTVSQILKYYTGTNLTSAIRVV